MPWDILILRTTQLQLPDTTLDIVHGFNVRLPYILLDDVISL